MRLHRRDAILTVAGGAVGLVGLTAAFRSMPAGAVPAGHAITLYDRRFISPKQIQAAAGGGRLIAVDGDITNVWRDDLLPLWRQGVTPVAGITTATALFCLAELGRSFDYKIMRDEQLAGPAGVALHVWQLAPREFA